MDNQFLPQTPPAPAPPLPAPLPIAPLPAVSPQETGFTPHQDDTGFTQEEVKSFTWRAWLKLGYIIFFIAAAGATGFIISKQIPRQKTSNLNGEVLLQTPYQPVLWKDFGEVFEPIIKMPLYYPSEGFTDKKFLLDSGALVSSLPREEAKKMGLSLAKLPRSTFGGFGGTTSFAYKDEIKVKLGEQEVVLPVVFTEAAGTKLILGRSGFFERYSIYFNAKQERIEIRK